MTIPYNADNAVRTACAKRMKRILEEVDEHHAKVKALQEELFIVHEQYLCYPHDFVADTSSYMYSIDKCSKCGAEHVA